MSASLTTLMRGLIAHAHHIPVDGIGLMRMMQSVGIGTLAAIALPFALLVVAAIAGNLVQHRLV